MFWKQLRPTYEIRLTATPASARAGLSAAGDVLKKGFHFRMSGEYGDLHLVAEENRLWSPHLSFFVTNDGTGSKIYARFAPRWQVWSLLWAVYLAMLCIIFFGAIFAYCQWMLERPTWGLAAAFSACLVIASVHTMATVGQWHCRDQMAQLREHLDQLLVDADLQIIS